MAMDAALCCVGAVAGTYIPLGRAPRGDFFSSLLEIDDSFNTLPCSGVGDEAATTGLLFEKDCFRLPPFSVGAGEEELGDVDGIGGRALAGGFEMGM